MADGPCSASRLIVARMSRSGTPSGVGCSDVSRMFHLTPRATPLVEVTGPLKLLLSMDCNFVIVLHNFVTHLEGHTMSGHLEIEDRGPVVIVRVDGGPHGLFGVDIANQLDELVDRVDRNPSVHAVVFTGAHPGRFVSHADVRWLQAEGAAVPE